MKISRNDLEKLFQSATSQVNFFLMVTCMIKLMGLQWDHLFHLFSTIFLWDITESGGLEITVMEDYFIIKDMLMICFLETKDHAISFCNYINRQHRNTKLPSETR